MKIETTEAMRIFNFELQEADELLANYSPFAGEISVQRTVQVLRSLGMPGSACGLQAAAEAVGYTFGGGK